MFSRTTGNAEFKAIAGEGARSDGLLSRGHLVCFPPLLGVLQNDTAPMIIDNSPFLDFLERSKAAKAGEVVIQTAIPYARGLGGGVDGTHLCRPGLRGFEFDHMGEGESGHLSHDSNVGPGFGQARWAAAWFRPAGGQISAKKTPCIVSVALKVSKMVA
jgi:hypothetical protein